MIYKLKLVLSVFIFFLLKSLSSQTSPYVEQLLDSVEVVTSIEEKVELYLDLSSEYIKTDYKKSLHYAELASSLALDADLSLLYHKSLFLKAQSFFYIDNYDSCFYYLDKIIYNQATIKDDMLLGDAYSLYGSALEDVRDLVKARSKLNIALKHHAAASNESGMATVYNRIAIIMRSQGTYDSAAYYSIQSLKMYSLAGDSIGMVKSYGSLGRTFISMREFEKAKEYLLKGKDLLQHLDHKRFLALTIQNLGIVHLKSGEFDSALYYFNQSLDFYLGSNDSSSIAFTYDNIGAVYDAEKKYDLAREYFQKSLHIHTKRNNLKGIVGSKSNIALSFARKGMYRTALLIYDTVLQLAKQYELAFDIAHTYDNIYHTYHVMGNYEKAFEYQSIYYNFQDSLLNIEKEKVISDLEIKYGKEKDQAEILALRNVTLEQDLEIRRKTNQRNIFTLLGLAVAIAVLMIYLITRQRMIKDKIIRLKEIERLNEEKKALAARSLVEGQEEERKRVATELHDGIGVLLSSVKLQFTNIEEKLPEKRELFQRATNLLEKASGDIRRISHNLMPGNLVRFGLFDALEDLFDTLGESDSMEAKIQIEGSDERLPENHEIMIYRIVQELINNTLKHGQASGITMLINNTEESVSLNYSDDGVGFVPEELKESGSLGLKSIQSRVDFLEGAMRIEASPGKGARFIIHIPVKK